MPCQSIPPSSTPSARPTRPTMPPSPRGCCKARPLSAAQEARIDRTATRLIEAIRANDDPARRRRGHAARIRALDQGGPGADGAGRGAAARARCRAPRTGSSRTSSARATSSITRPNPAPSWSTPRPGRSASRRASSSPARRRRAPSARLAKRLGLPAVRTATRQAMRLMGNHFVLGETIEEALDARRKRSGGRLSLFLRHARRRRAHRRGRRALFRFLCARDRGDRPRRRQTAPARPARHFGQALGAASALSRR